jgi:phospholipid/cholesterol/gamma-HCH transport system substrate-binding protein
VVAKVEGGEGAVPMLLTDAGERARLERSLASIEKASANLERVSAELQGTTGLLPKLINDEAYGRELSAELKSLLENLNRVAEKLDHGEGSMAKLVNDPELYQAMKDIATGINESAILKKILRNRQKKGAEKRLEEATEPSRSPPEARP